MRIRREGGGGGEVGDGVRVNMIWDKDIDNIIYICMSESDIPEI